METEGAKLWILREVLQLVDADSVSSMPEAGDAASQIQETEKIPLEKRSCEVQLRANLVTSTCLSRCAKTMKTRSESLWGRWTCKRIFVALRFFVLDLSSPRERERERERESSNFLWLWSLVLISHFVKFQANSRNTQFIY